MEAASEADVDIPKMVETPGVLNFIEFCQPCKEQDNEKQAEFWCTNCPELLCENCYGHHKVLKATRCHKMLSIDDYHMIGKSIAESEYGCHIHQTNEIKFFCVTHNTPCCNTCKEETHKTECNVQVKEDILKNTNIKDYIDSTIETMKEMVENMRSELPNDCWNESSLEKQKQIFNDKMKSGRQQVQHFLDEFENDAREKFERAFSVAKEVFQDNKRNIEHKLNVVQKRTETAERIKNSEFSKFTMFLISYKFHADYMEEKLQIENLVKELKDVPFVVEPIYDINHKAKQITLGNGFEVGSDGQSHIGKMQPEMDNIELSSSTVEAEECMSDETVHLERDILRENVQCTSENIITEQEDINEQNDIYKQEDKSEQENKSEEEDISEDEDISEEEDIYEEEDTYWPEEHFFIERRNKDISVGCIRFLSWDEIVMTEDSNPRILVYNTNGFKVGQVKFDEGPDTIAVIDEKQIAVSVKKKVVFVDIGDMRIGKEKNLRDYIRGLSYANDKLFACLEHRGVLIMGLSGDVYRTVPFIKGNLYICCPMDEMIYSVKRGISNTLQHYDMNSNKKTIYDFECSSHVNGLNCDEDGNIYIAIADSEIIKFDVITNAFVTLLATHDGIDNPYSTDCYDNGDRLLTIDYGREVKIFQKQNS